MSIYFDISDFSSTNDTKYILIFINGKSIKIYGEKLDDSDFWVIKSVELQDVLQDQFRTFYSMFLGILLTALHENNTQTPIFGICLDDVDRVYGNSSELQSLVNSIALGTYVSDKEKLQK